MRKEQRAPDKKRRRGQTLCCHLESRSPSSKSKLSRSLDSDLLLSRQIVRLAQIGLCLHWFEHRRNRPDSIKHMRRQENERHGEQKARVFFFDRNSKREP